MKKKRTINIYIGPIQKMIKVAAKRPGAFKLNVREKRAYLEVREIPRLILEERFSVDFGDEEEEAEKRMTEFKNICASASPEELEEIDRILKAQLIG